MKKILVSLVAMMFLFVCIVSNLYAVTVESCNVSNLTGSIDCVYFPGKNDKAHVLNDADVFGINTWVFITKTDEPHTLYGLKSDPMTFGNSGTWKFSSMVWDDWSYVTLVIKAGNAFTAYLMDNNSKPTSGDWASAKDLSHLTLYVANKKQQVPEPATLLLFGAGIAGLAMYRRKRS